MSLVSRLFSRTTSFDAKLDPQQPFYAIGDIHGCCGKLDSLLAKMNPPGSSIVFVGDYVDRGEESAQVLKTVKDLDERDSVTCLMGNHEEMLLDFLDYPLDQGRRWVKNGGLQTLASFGVRGITTNPNADDLEKSASKLRDAMGEDLIGWIRGLPSFWMSGNVAVVHAAADPSIPLSQQSDKTLRWGHPEFERRTRSDGLWIIHGHTIVDRPTVKDGRIAIDTGAYASGHLTAAQISEDSVNFVQV